MPLELQARWIAYTWGGAVAGPSEAELRSAIEAYRARRGMSQKTRMNLAALTFARAAGVEPNLDDWPHLRRALLFGPLAPSCFRLQGPDALPDAPARFVRDAAAFGAITSNEMTEREQRYWSLVEAARYALSALSPITLRARRSSISSSVKPRPRRTSSLCCPSVGGGNRWWPTGSRRDAKRPARIAVRRR